MKWIAVVGLILVLASCGKKSDPEPVFTNPDGVWTYQTPDKAIMVEFELKTSGGTLEILNSKITVSGTLGEAAGQLSGVALPMIDQLRINANDAVIVTPYYITFMTCTMGSNYNMISVADVQYTYPGNTKTLQNISIVRK